MTKAHEVCNTLERFYSQWEAINPAKVAYDRYKYLEKLIKDIYKKAGERFGVEEDFFREVYDLQKFPFEIQVALQELEGERDKSYKLWRTLNDGGIFGKYDLSSDTMHALNNFEFGHISTNEEFLNS